MTKLTNNEAIHTITILVEEQVYCSLNDKCWSQLEDITRKILPGTGVIRACREGLRDVQSHRPI